MDTLVPWLLLLPQLPPKPDYLRVKLQRRLQRLGAVALKNGVYALPARDETVEDSEWLRRELVDDGAELIVCSSTLLGGLSDAALTDRFQSARNDEYDDIADSAREALASGDRELRAAELVRLRKTLTASHRVDFFDAPRGADAEQAVSALEETVIQRERAAIVSKPVAVQLGRTWVTRSGVFVDRIASAWLIRRFIDPRAKFKFVDGSRGYRPVAGELRFDMYQAEYTHQGDRCSFETLLDAFGLDDPSLAIIGEIVHDIDLQDDKYQRPETSGIQAVLAGIRQSEARDDRRVTRGRSLFDSLYVQLSRQERPS